MMKKLRDMLIGQVVMVVMFILAGCMYEGIGYSSIDDIMPYFQIAAIELVICVPIGTVLIIGINTIIMEVKFNLNKKKQIQNVSK